MSELNYITSSNGTLAVDDFGTVIPERSKYETPAGHDGDLRPIFQFDIAEWKRTYPGEEFSGGDILDFGYWFYNGDRYYPPQDPRTVVYEPPCEDWRKEIKAELGLQ